MSSEVAANEPEKVIFDSVQIQELLPHRYPFLLIDKVVEWIDGERIVCIKNVTINEHFFVGHFPHKPVMPGVMILESMAQAGAFLAKSSTDGIARDKNILLVGATDVKWKKQVVPGDTMRVHMRLLKRKAILWMMEGKIEIEGKIVASAIISACEV